MTNEAKGTGSPLDEIRRTQKRICSRALKYAIGIALALLFFKETAIAKGILLGTIFSIVNFVLMGHSVPMALGRTRAKARMVGLFSILGRYMILAIPLIIGIKWEGANFWAVVVGLFAVQLFAFIEYVVVDRYFNTKT